MKPLLVIVDQLSDWAPYHPDSRVITIHDFLAQHQEHSGYVINLCEDYSYQSSGYYGSLLAEARGQQVFPSVRAINDLNNFEPGQLLSLKEGRLLDSYSQKHGNDKSLDFILYFGSCPIKELQPVARHLFNTFHFPILKIETVQRAPSIWMLESIEILGLENLDEPQQTLFAEALDQFSRKIWRSRSKKRYKYDLAILVNPDEKLPPSNKGALQAFEKAGKQLGLDVDFITRHDINRLGEYDALFIRETTSVTHETYHFAQRADHLGLVVIDHPSAILTCANKVYLHEVLARNHIPTPKSLMLMRDNQLTSDAIAEQLGLPVILKIPDGAFSIGVEKANSTEELEQKLASMLEQSAIVLLQEFMPTDYDWRIGVLNGRAFYACRYYMAKSHWQIYNHAAKRNMEQSGMADAMGIHQTPKQVISVATKAARCMGDGLFGVDLKEKDGRVVVIEVNDNPSLDKGVEDLYLGPDLYHQVMQDFLRRLELAHGRS